MKNFRVVLLAIACFFLMIQSSFATNWEIVAIKKNTPAVGAEGYVMDLKDPASSKITRTLMLSEKDLKEIKEYFSVLKTSDMLGYQFIPDEKHTGLIREINQMK